METIKALLSIQGELATIYNKQRKERKYQKQKQKQKQEKDRVKGKKVLKETNNG
jgi:predicted histidine transporter YuiF (NhaC family)